MGLHHRARELLFRDFIERNYRDVDKTTKNELLKISLDNILKDKLDTRTYNTFCTSLTQTLDMCLSGKESQVTGNILGELFRQTKVSFLSLWLLNSSLKAHQESLLELTCFKGNIPKYIKNWNIKKSQLDLILSRLKKNLHQSIALKEVDKKDFFGEIREEVLLHPISFKNKFQGFLLSSNHNPKISLSQNYFNSFSHLFTIAIYLKENRAISLAKNKSQQRQRQLTLDFFANLIKSDAINPNCLPQLAKTFETPEFLLAKLQGKKVKLISEYGLQPFKPFTIAPLPRVSKRRPAPGQSFRIF